MMKFKLNPLQKITAILSIYSLAAILINLDQEVIYHLFATVGFALLLFVIFSKLSGKKKNIYNTLISSLIIFLVLHYGVETKDLIYPLLATFITIFTKFFLELKGSPIINPVVFGLLLAHLLTMIIPGLEPLFISWWGAGYSYNGIPIALIIIAVWILLLFKTWRKFPALISFLALHAIIIAAQQDIEFLKFTFTDATIYFFASIMLIEPRTSPILKKDQIIYGILAALVYNGLKYIGLNHFDLLAIVVANLYFFIQKQQKLKRTTTE